MRSRAHRTRTLGVLGAVLLIAGVLAIVLAVGSQQSAPQPSPAAASPVEVIPSAPTNQTPSNQTPSTAQTPGSPQSNPVAKTLPRSVPTHVSVPAIGVESDLPQIGLNDKQEIQTPPLDRDSHAYWLDVSPTPGQLGPATIIGHVDSTEFGPAVFFKLGALRQRDTISVTRTDGIVAEFQVEKVVEYPKAQFPTQAVYGNLDHSGLRLITCGGLFDPSQHSYESNIVVFASLVSAHPSQTPTSAR